MCLVRLKARIAGASTPGRNRRLTAGILTGVLVKGITFFLTLVTVPMTLHYLGLELYGLWVTMISLLAWFSLMDLGLANGLTPILAKLFGESRDDLAREYIATAFWGLCGMVALAGAVAIVAWPLIDWKGLFNLKGEGAELTVSSAMALAVVFFLLRLPLTINQRVLLAYQEGKVANLSQLIVSSIGVLGIFAATKTELGLVALVLGYSGSQLVAMIAITLWIYIFFKPSLRPTVVPKSQYTRKVFAFGGMFFLMQIGSLLVFQKDLILITHFLGAEQTAAYSIAWQLFLYINMLNLLIAPYFSPGFGEAHAAGDTEWVRSAFRNYLRGSIAVAVPATVLVVVSHRLLIDLWVGGGVQPTLWTVFWLAVWTVLFAALGPCIALLQGVGYLKRFTFYYFAASVVSAVASFFAIPRLGPSSGIMMTTISYLLILAGPTVRDVVTVLRQPKRADNLDGRQAEKFVAGGGV